MAKGKGALFSLKAQGRIGDAVYMRSSRGEVIASKMPDRRAEPTAAQTAARLRYAQGCALWHTLTGAELAYWQDRAGSVSTNGGFSEFMSSFLKGEFDMDIGSGVALNLYDWASWSPIGAWTLAPHGGGGYYHLNNFTNPHVGDKVTIPVRLSPGEWQLYVTCRFGNSRGIWQFMLDGVLIEEHDEYSASILYFTDPVGSSFTINDYANHELTIECIGKNPASLNYIANWQQFHFIRKA